MEVLIADGRQLSLEYLVGKRKIPVKNVWLLFVYAHDLAQYRDRFDSEVEESPDFKSLIAKLLCHATEKRLRRNLSFGYQEHREILRRVRGRIDILKSYSSDLFRKGQVACRFEQFTVNTPRNRFVRAALNRLTKDISHSEGELRARCKLLEVTLGRIGVGSDMPSREEIVSDQFTRHDADDRLLISLAHAAFNLVLPSEVLGGRPVFKSRREDTKFSNLFEKAVGNFFEVELPGRDGWRVSKSTPLEWPVKSGSSGIENYLPAMKTDITIENTQTQRRIIVDTKFTSAFTRSQYRDSLFKSANLYQIYSYLRSQEKKDDPMSLDADGILLYPAIQLNIDETALIQNHRIRFVTVDLSRPSNEVIDQLISIPTLNFQY